MIGRGPRRGGDPQGTEGGVRKEQARNQGKEDAQMKVQREGRSEEENSAWLVLGLENQARCAKPLGKVENEASQPELESRTGPCFCE